jgi:hypothetical protein
MKNEWITQGLKIDCKHKKRGRERVSGWASVSASACV